MKRAIAGRKNNAFCIRRISCLHNGSGDFRHDLPAGNRCVKPAGHHCVASCFDNLVFKWRSTARPHAIRQGAGHQKEEQVFHPINSPGAQPSCAGSYQRRSKNDGASLNSPHRIFPFFSRRASSGPYERKPISSRARRNACPPANHGPPRSLKIRFNSMPLAFCHAAGRRYPQMKNGGWAIFRCAASGARPMPVFSCMSGKPQPARWRHAEPGGKAE